MFAVMDSEWHDKSSRPQKKLHPEGILGNESSNDFNPRFDPDINTSESFSSDRSSRNSGAITPTFNPFAPYEDLRAPTSLVSSSSAASSDDLFQVIPTPATKPHINVHSTGALDIQSKASSNDHVSSDSSAKSDDTEVGSSSGPAPASTDPNISYEPRLHTLSPTQSPPVQNMDRSGDLEPYRIPSSEFTMSKSPFPADWSIASNDSLFSIQLGDNSFSRDNSFKGDHDIMWGDDLLSPSELLKSSELMEKTANNTDRLISSSRHSDESGTSVQSFTFPILTGMDIGDPIKLDAQKFRQKLQYHEQNVQKPDLLPTSQPTSKPCCGSCGSCCCCRSCCSWQSCCSWLFCCSCHGCRSLFSCCLQHCCCRRS
ncbi:hypothetical protein SAY86_019994 [Trapa natans]|uniref:Uncharacterized protein n=1 Tax=Trapa natans TaxID=22666 RepID=A0AAN7R565_TRANT|nr:hypothetical protein SAY86_019994 [Trapa natans]